MKSFSGDVTVRTSPTLPDVAATFGSTPKSLALCCLLKIKIPRVPSRVSYQDNKQTVFITPIDRFNKLMTFMVSLG